ncbi:hypothetical protein FHU31_000147 [Mycolicibacterium fluoranthenivorans]|uniref:DNA 3'-5' helicase n=1 Tax=Mycolicibacterium fluoranthenivorans TaxID=258505 RepID=A0A7X5R508_9MYCO|nr:UvrD-helicase domain-containing protein [Mycolicibacterium fluoranthenivorans]NIH93191.1 hypothetical protein [Mycolicibacterium fluoranthenivorans]
MATSPVGGAGLGGRITPRGKQSDVVYFDPGQDLVVLGTAGTGKTTMAVLRAKYLAHPMTPNHGPVLLVTYNNALVRYLRHLVPDALGDVAVETYAKFARGYLASIGKMPSGWGNILEGGRLRTTVARAVTSARLEFAHNAFFDRHTGFFVDELAWIADMGIEALDDYLKADRVGRKTALMPGHRSAVWRIRSHYLQHRAADGVPYDWHDLASAVRVGLGNDLRPRKYRHIVIDEGQDLSPEAIRSLVAAVQPGGTVCFFGDYHQQIYGQGLSWRRCGLRVGSVDRFADNLRNTTQIARVAIAMSTMPHMAAAGVDDLVVPVEPAADGTIPTLLKCRDRAAEISEVQRVAVNQSAVGTVGVLARTLEDASRAVAGVPGIRRLKESPSEWWDPSPGIYYGTYHSAKGLEFDVVILPFADSDRLPNQEVVNTLGLTDASSRDGKSLYVAVTRAKAELLVTYTSALSPLLPREPGLWAEVAQ